LRRALPHLALLALLALAAGPAAAQSKAAAKPAAKAAPAGAFDARDPAALSRLLTGMKASVQAGKDAGGRPVLKVQTPGGGFGAQYVGCNPQGKACTALAFSTAFDQKTPTLAHLNAFNRRDIACRGYMTPDGRPNVMYSTVLTSRMTAADMNLHLGVWQGCLGAFGQFTRDPAGFMAEAE
jgi:hypothetical protein